MPGLAVSEPRRRQARITPVDRWRHRRRSADDGCDLLGRRWQKTQIALPLTLPRQSV
jgi:hypothetical protein